MAWVRERRVARPWAKSRPADAADGTVAGGTVVSGLVGGLLASLCCLPPALALALGLGGSTFLISLGARQTEFQLAGLVVTGLVAWWILKRRAKACRVDRNPLPFLLLAVGSFAAAYLALAYLVTPFLYQVYAGR